MSKRVFVLVFLLFFRGVLGWIVTLKFTTGRLVSITGNVVNVYYKDSNCIIRVGNFLVNSGSICAAVPGSKITVSGKLERRVIDSFQGRLWLDSAEIETLDKNSRTQERKNSRREMVDNFRESLVSRYKKFLPEPEAGLVAGVVLGYKKDIGQEFYQQMIKSGAVHIAVASGYNILLVGGLVLSLCFWFWRRSKAVIVALTAMIFYALLAGGEPPVVRAVWMAGLMYLGQAVGRGSVSHWILTLTVWVMLMFEPALIESVSFQLSVAASFGLMVIEPWCSKKLEEHWGNRLVSWAGNTGFLSSVSTMMMTLPIIWWHFGRMSLMGVFSNLFILPLIPPLMIFGAGMLVVPAVFSVPVYALAHWIVLVIKFFGT